LAGAATEYFKKMAGHPTGIQRGQIMTCVFNMFLPAAFLLLADAAVLGSTIVSLTGNHLGQLLTVIAVTITCLDPWHSGFVRLGCYPID
jgi:hypothetical protein